MNINTKVRYWLELSDYDLDTADAILRTKRFLYVGFMCHQSIEKILKAVYIKVNEEEPPRIHNLARLAQKANIYHDFSNDQKDFLDILEPLNIEARYPTHKEKLMKSLDEKRCQQLLDQTREVSKWIKKKLYEK